MTRQRWRMALKLFPLLGLSLMLGGCISLGFVVSIHPFYADEDVIFEPGLLGEWDESVFRRRDGEPPAYIDRNREGDEAIVHLARLGDHLFLDMYPAEDDSDPLKLPLHLITRARIADDRFEIAPLDLDWVRAKVSQGEVAGVETSSRHFLLTSSTAELRAFLSNAADVEEAWDEWETTNRRVETDAEAPL